jgi:hypothetical protein
MIETKPEPLDLIAEIKRLKQIAPAKHSHQYRPPNTKELETFRALADALHANNLNRAAKLANQLNYCLIRFREQSTQQSLLGLLEKRTEPETMRGWGSYFLNPSANTNALTEAPHILFDRFTPEIAAQVFLFSHARGLLMGGAHRNANGAGSADVCDPIGSIFQAVHESWSGDGAKTWQIHGFSNPATKGFPETTQIVLSTGEGNISNEILVLEETLEKQGFSAYVYNELSADSAMNRKLNGDAAGTVFSPLSGTQNVQGRYNRQIGIPFLHLEIESRIRTSNQRREKVASTIANAMAASA